MLWETSHDFQLMGPASGRSGCPTGLRPHQRAQITCCASTRQFIWLRFIFFLYHEEQAGFLKPFMATLPRLAACLNFCTCAAVEVCLLSDSIARPSDIKDRVKYYFETKVAMCAEGSFLRAPCPCCTFARFLQLSLWCDRPV